MTLQPVTLVGRIIRLEPLSLTHHEDLLRVALEPALWRHTWSSVASAEDLEHYIKVALLEQDAGRSLPFATIDLASGRAIGSTRFGNIEPAHRRLEIGWTWLGTVYQRTGANTEAKLLQLTHAFETLKYQRVEFKTDAANVKSRAALERIGATFEGIFRKHGIATAARVRDTAWYAIVDDDWPRIRSAFERWLDPANFDEAGRQRARLSELVRK